MDNKFIGLMVGLTVGVLMVSGFLWPVISDATATETTYTNDGYFRLSKITADEEHTITWDYTAPYNFVVDGTDTVEIPFGSTNAPIFPYSVISTDNWAVRFISTNTGTRIDLAVFGNSPSLIWGVSTDAQDAASFELANGTATITKEGANAVTLSYESAFIPDSDGIYIMKKSNETAHILGDSEIYSTGRTGASFNGTITNCNINVKGNINDGVTVTLINPNTVTAENIAINSIAIGGYTNLFAFDDVSFVLNDGTNTDNASYSQVIVPYKVTAEKSSHLDTMQIAMIGVIGTLGAIVLIAAAAGSIRRLD